MVEGSPIEFADAAMGYCLHVPCCNKGCQRDVEWYGNQHGCVEGPLCEPHMAMFVARVDSDLDTYGYALCNVCRLAFTCWDSFARVRRI